MTSGIASAASVMPATMSIGIRRLWSGRTPPSKGSVGLTGLSSTVNLIQAVLVHLARHLVLTRHNTSSLTSVTCSAGLNPLPFARCAFDPRPGHTLGDVWLSAALSYAARGRLVVHARPCEGWDRRCRHSARDHRCAAASGSRDPYRRGGGGFGLLGGGGGG